ncbi:MAG: BMC domain-containing protein [Candidatus Sericytochromatia bacterium]|nr:BMC domain-containing protein [Candidatus Sericytochromatia bacterium]
MTDEIRDSFPFKPRLPGDQPPGKPGPVASEHALPPGPEPDAPNLRDEAWPDAEFDVPIHEDLLDETLEQAEGLDPRDLPPEAEPDAPSLLDAEAWPDPEFDVPPPDEPPHDETAPSTCVRPIRSEPTGTTAWRGLHEGRPADEAPALAMLEFGSVVAAWEAADAVCKRAPVDLLLVRPASPGKGLVVFAGAVAEVEESMQAGRAVAPEVLVDAMLLPHAASDLLLRLRTGTATPDAGSPVALVESFACAGALAAADAALKVADVRLHLIKLADGLGGKAWFVLGGGLEDLEVAVTAARAHLDPLGLTCRTLVLPSPHPDLWVHWQEA